LLGYTFFAGHIEAKEVCHFLLSQQQQQPQQQQLFRGLVNL